MQSTPTPARPDLDEIEARAKEAFELPMGCDDQQAAVFIFFRHHFPALLAYCRALENQLDLSEGQRRDLLRSVGFRKACNRDANEAIARAEAAEARASALEETVRRLTEALEPFAKYAIHQLDRGMPRAVAEDDGTPVWGDEHAGEPTIYVADLKRVAALSPSTPVEAGETLAGDLARALNRMLYNFGRPRKHEYTSAIAWAKALEDYDDAERVFAKATAAGLLATPSAEGDGSHDPA
ncbi:MAG TPA: hypothetical protein VD860_01845 [Azospirillum sp.]|nr:hypothetical protein [Azospirillum sp.]